MDILKVLVIIAFIIVTICTVKLHPSIHQPMIIEDADFKLTRISDTLTPDSVTTTTATVEPQNIQSTVQNQNFQNIQQTVSTETQPVSTQNIQTQNNQVRYIQPEDVAPYSSKIKNVRPKTQQIPNRNNDDEMSDLEMVNQILKGIQEQQQTTRPMPSPRVNQNHQTTSTPKRSSNFKNPYMTEQEEIIAWNKWRSNLQNQIMNDSDIDYAPLGTMFMFTFVVDKYGNVSNIKVECSNPNYMNVARNNVKPAIARLQKKSILNFPRGTQRTSTVVTGVFLIGTQNRYSTPNDYSDYERVKY